jgi:hypothetical protein
VRQKPDHERSVSRVIAGAAPIDFRTLAVEMKKSRVRGRLDRITWNLA